MALGFFLIFLLELLYFSNLTGNPFFRYSVFKSESLNVIIETNMYGRGDFPTGLFHYFYIIFTDNFLALFYSFIFIATAYFILNKKKETYNLLFWFVPLLLYLSFGSASITKYVLIPAASRFLFIINIPGILLLSYFLSQNEQPAKRFLMPSVILLLLITSIGYIFISEHRFSLYNERDAYEYLNSLPAKKIYTDHRSFRILDYFSGYKINPNIRKFNSYEFSNPEKTYALNISQVKDSYVVINSELVDFLASSKIGIKFPDEVFNVPEDWVLKKEFSRNEKDKISIYYVP